MNISNGRHVTNRRFQQALDLLLQAHHYVREIGCAPWDFAVELRGLQELGMSHNDLRWLLARGLLSHAVEVDPRPGQRRAFEERCDWVLTDRTCFLLTSAGVNFAMDLLEPGAVPPVAPVVAPAPSAATRRSDAPHWDSTRRTLCYRGGIIKQFKVPAPNQEQVLAVFQEEAWPYRIDDPLPMVEQLEPKRRLHDTINSLNRNQRIASLRFFGDGQGEGICWQPIDKSFA